MTCKPVTAQRFGTALRRMREIRGLTQSDVGIRAELHVNTIARMERGETSPSFETIIKLADALQSRPSTIFALAEVG
jgi:transcriptional regulator with XRE-family HTH domain